MAIEKLDTDVRLPYDESALLSGSPAQLTDYLRQLIKTLQELLGEITIVANYGLDLNDGDAVYFALRQSDGTYPIGTWRRKQVGDNLEDQIQLVTDTWTTVHTRERRV